LQPIFGGDHAYTAFYPAVILAGYLAGRRAGLFATALSAGLAYWVFVEPSLQLKTGASAFAPLIFFAANAAVAIYLITALDESVRRIAREQSRAESAARQNADLFRELNARITHHLQLVSGVLALQADREPQEKVSDALAKASQTSLMLARAHREVAGGGSEPVEFSAFARHLVAAMLASRGLAADIVRISGETVALSPHDATSLGVALLECLSVLLAHRDAGRLTVAVSCDGHEVALRLTELDPAGVRIARLADGHLLRAAIAQLGARLEIAIDDTGGGLEIFVPALDAPAPLRERAAATLH
jgi:two-component sensor histidine kinase